MNEIRLFFKYLTLYSVHVQFKIGLTISAKQSQKLLRASGKGLGVVKPGEVKAPGRPYRGLTVSKGSYRKAGEGILVRECGD